MTALEVAIADMYNELAELGLGRKNQPKEDSVAWYTMRAKAAGLSMLRAALAAEREDPIRFEEHYKKYLNELKGKPEAVVREPD